MTEQTSHEVNVDFQPSRFRPAWWLRGAHAQTVGAKFLRPVARVPLVRERIELPDGDFLDLDVSPAPGAVWSPIGETLRDTAPGTELHAARRVHGDGIGGGRDAGSSTIAEATPPAAGPIVVVLHGLEGSARRRYTLLTYAALREAGITAVGLNFRGCSGEPNRLRRSYHSGETGDLRHVVSLIARRYPDSPLGAIGFSLGGNVLLKYLGEEGDGARSMLRAAVAISVPYDLAAGADNLERGLMGRVYSRYFMRSLTRKAAAMRDRLVGHCDVDRAIRARTLREFDDALTAPINGFADSADYYRRSSSAQFLPHIRVPTLLIHAADDPFLPGPALPRDAIGGNAYLVPAISPRGGHVAFVTGRLPWRPVFWAENEAARFMAHYLLARGEEAEPAAVVR